MKMIFVLMTIVLTVLAVFPLVAARWSAATSGPVPIALILVVGLMIRTWRHPQ